MLKAMQNSEVTQRTNQVSELGIGRSLNKGTSLKIKEVEISL